MKDFRGSTSSCMLHVAQPRMIFEKSGSTFVLSKYLPQVKLNQVQFQWTYEARWAQAERLAGMAKASCVLFAARRITWTRTAGVLAEGGMASKTRKAKANAARFKTKTNWRRTSRKSNASVVGFLGSTRTSSLRSRVRTCWSSLSLRMQRLDQRRACS